MKTIINLIGLLISIQGFCQSEAFEIETEQLADNFVNITVLGPHGVYSSYLCEGIESEFETTAYEDGEFYISNNIRDHYVESIDLGMLPSDILYFNNINENTFVYGGSDLLILDGENHNQVASFNLIDTVSIFNMAYMPISPYRYQLAASIVSTTINRNFIFCAPEGGDLFIIESKAGNDFEIFQRFKDNYHQSQLISSSVQTELIISNINGCYWILNYWDGTCKIKKINWNFELKKFELSNERVFVNDEIIDFKILEGNIRLALLYDVLEINKSTLLDIHAYNNTSVDKLEDNYGHIKGEKELLNFNGGTYMDDEMITLATGSCYDPDNGRVYFTGYKDDLYSPGFKVINYNPVGSWPTFKSFDLIGAMDVEFNPDHDLNSINHTVFSVGRDRIRGFDNDGYPYENDNTLSCHFGYRIGMDPSLAITTRNTFLVACLKDGLLVQFQDLFGQTGTPKIINTGISSSMTCYDYDPINSKLYMFYNGDGGTNVYFEYKESTNQLFTKSITGYGEYPSFSFTDCIFNNESNLLLANMHNHCGDYNQIFTIVNDEQVLTENFYERTGSYTNFNESVYFYSKGYDPEHSLNRFWVESGIFNSDNLEVANSINAITVNEDDQLIYATCNGLNVITSATLELDEVDYFYLNNNDPIDVSYIEASQKIYVAQHSYGIIEVYDTDFIHILDIDMDGFPKEIIYNSYQKEAYVVCEDEDSGYGFTKIVVVNCINDQIVKEKIIRRNDGYVYNNINDQLYFQNNFPYLNTNNELEYNIKAFNNFDDEFSNKICISLYTFSDLYLSKKRSIPSKPSINYEDNIIYFGNYGAANATKIKAYDEKLSFRSGWKWLSFPRMERYKDETFDAIPLLERIEPWPPNNLYMEYDPDNEPLQYIQFVNGNWNQQSNMDELKSSQGYKLNYQLPSIQNCTIRMEGAKLDYNTTIDLGVGENWVGYFLDKNLYPEQCLPANIWEALVQIKTQYWTMTKVSSNTPPYWFLVGKKTPFKYGDLVILKTNHLYPGFQWQNWSTGTNEMVIQQTTYYSFEEQADYLPFYVETDSTSEIMEIAVLADGIVKGAAVREPGDTLVEVNGYLEGVASGAVIEFETWDGYKSEPVDKNGYVVIDHQRSVREKRSIYAGEKAYYYHVSLKSKEVYELPPEISMINCQPNPFSQSIEFSFRMNKENYINLEIYNMSGNRVKTIIAGNYPEGYYRFAWKGENEAGGYIAPGVYFYRMSTGSGTVMTDKIVMVSTE